MEAMAGGRHGDAALEWFIMLMSPIKAPPGFSNHSNGLAVDFSTTDGGVLLGPNTNQRAAWRALAALMARRQRCNVSLPPARQRGVALGLGVKVACSAALACIACSASPARQRSTAAPTPTGPLGAEPLAGAPAPILEWPANSRLFLAKNARAGLELRAAGSDLV